MTDYLDTEIAKRSLAEMAPRMKILRSLIPGYVEELETWQQKAREYGQRYARPRALDIDRKCRQDPRYFDWDLIKQSSPFGFLSMLVPKGAGGGGQMATAMAIVMEEICVVCPGIANIFGAHGLGISGVLLGMDFYHYDRALADVARADKRGEPVLFAAAITEPEAGSDEEDAGFLRKARLVTDAKPASGGYLLNGRKVFISNGSIAKYTTVIAPLDKAKAVETQSAFLVTQGDPGFSVGKVEDKMGMKACPAAELIFEDCFVPRRNLIGREGEGVRFTEIVLGASRGPVGAIATGTARGAFERAVAFAKEKKTGGRRLIDHQWVQIKLADMARKIHLARQAYLDSCMTFDFMGVPKLMRLLSSRFLLEVVPRSLRLTSLFEKVIRSEKATQAVMEKLEQHVDPEDLRHIQQYSSIAKVSGSDIAVEIAYEALQIAGIEGSLHRNELEKIYRDAKLTQIYEGTNQLNRHNIFVNTFVRDTSHAR
jgi:alkylation response protein AidB-like acyl-CoA dehydrogenase